MGTKYRYNCPKCQYSEEISGGVDMGMSCQTQTILCVACRRLYDVVVSSEFPPHTRPPNCPKSRWHPTRPWNHPDQCPKCGSTMRQGDSTMLWD